mgnify:CR=1 FL=1
MKKNNFQSQKDDLHEHTHSFHVILMAWMQEILLLYSNVHFSFLRFDLSFARPLAFEESSVFRDLISRIRSKNTWKKEKSIEKFSNYVFQLTLSTFSLVFAEVST